MHPTVNGTRTRHYVYISAIRYIIKMLFAFLVSQGLLDRIVGSVDKININIL